MLRLVLHITMLTTMLFPIREITLFRHLCGNKLVSFELLERTVVACCGDAEESCGGCKNEETNLSIDNFQAPQGITAVHELSFLYNIEYSAQGSTHNSLCNQILFASNREPPVRSGKHLSILNRSILL